MSSMYHNYMSDPSIAESLAGEISQVLDVKASVVSQQEHVKEAADHIWYCVLFPYASFEGSIKGFVEYAYITVHNPDEWRQLKEFFKKSALYLQYEQMETGTSFLEK